MHGRLVFLQLSPEFGGTKFGPFPGPEIRLGSDPAASDITLPEALGVLPQHVKILIQTDGSFIVAPTERTAAVHVYRGSGRPKHIATATALSANDSFALVTAEGPRFIILSEQPKQDKTGPKKREKKGMAPTKEGIWAEIKRIGFTQVFRSRLGNMAMRAWTMVKTGTIFTPRFIVAALFLSTGWFAAVFAGIAAIGGLFALGSANDELQEVRGDLAACETVGEDPDIYQLATMALGDSEWSSSLRDDDMFFDAFSQSLKSIVANEREYRWVWRNEDSDFARLRRYATDDRALGPEFGRIFAYTAAVPVGEPNKEWHLWRDTLLGPSESLCGRGPARMTYLQSLNLGVPAQPDTLVSTVSVMTSELSEKRQLLLQIPGMTPDRMAELEGSDVEIAMDPLTSTRSCMFIEGEDTRTEPRDLARALAPTLGPSARGVPSEGGDYWMTSRLARYYAAGTDLPEDYEALDFSGNPPSLVLDAYSSSQRDVAIEQAAAVAARAAIIPCLALKYSDDPESAAQVVGELPRFNICASLFWLLE